jgi:hypothetical protein
MDMKASTTTLFTDTDIGLQFQGSFNWLCRLWLEEIEARRLCSMVNGSQVEVASLSKLVKGSHMRKRLSLPPPSA